MSALLRLRPYLLRYSASLWFGLLLIIVANLVGLFLPYLIRLSIDSLQGKIDAGLLLRYAALIVFVGLVQAAIQFYSRQSLAKVSRQVEYELRSDLFHKFQKQELDYFQHNKVGDLVARSTNDLTAVRGLLGPGIINLMNTIVAFIATVILMFTIDVPLTLYSVFILPLITIIFVIVGRQIERRYKRVQDQFGEVSARAQENFSGIRIVKAYVQEAQELTAFRAENEEYVRRSIRYAQINALLWPVMFFIAGLATIILLWRGGLDVISGRITLGQMIQFTGYLAQLTWPMIAFGWVVNLFQQGAASMGRINEVMDHQSVIVDVGIGSELESRERQGEVEFRQVSFAYGEREVLHDINIHIPAGTSLAIVGPTGSGKSSLVNLLPRLFDVTKGKILVDGRDVREIPLETLRQQIGYVPQEPFLFSIPLEENIRFGAESLSDEGVQQVMETAQLAKDVVDFPGGIGTMIGERGVTLSGGQKQRTTIARALAKNPTILVMDDAMSSVDTHTEAEILSHLRQVMQRRTTILISHRCSTVKNFQKIVVLDEGRIVEEGTHRSLLEKQGLYAEMYRRQLVGEELEENA